MIHTWSPSVIGARLYDLAVYDRWGQQVFHSTDPKSSWNGEGYPQGAYTFKAWLSEYGALEKEYVGVVSIVR